MGFKYYYRMGGGMEGLRAEKGRINEGVEKEDKGRGREGRK